MDWLLRLGEVVLPDAKTADNAQASLHTCRKLQSANHRDIASVSSSLCIVSDGATQVSFAAP